VTTIELTETEPAQAWLTAEQGRRLAATEVVRAVPSPHQTGLWDIAPAGKVGVARVGDLEVWIAPKLRIDRLLFLLGDAANPKGWQDETVRLDVRRDLVAAIAQPLWRQTERAVRRGLLQGYRTVEETSLVLRGRLREADQLRRHYGLAIPMEVRHDDFTVDIPENQILLAAATRMLTVPRLDAESRQHLAGLRVRLADATRLIRGSQLPRWHPSRLNERYHTALRLAEIVWRATAPEHTPGAVAANGFLLDLPKIFEDFVTVAMTEHLRSRHAGTGIPQYRCHLDEASTVHMRPDLVWERNGRPVAVIDAKYKRERPAGYPDADLYQMLAYCTALGLPVGHLVYAAGSAEPARHVVRHAGIEIRCHTLDLAKPPAAVLAQLARISDDLSIEPEPTLMSR